MIHQYVTYELPTELERNAPTDCGQFGGADNLLSTLSHPRPTFANFPTIKAPYTTRCFRALGQAAR